MLWDIDYTLLNAGGVGRVVYDSVFRDMFGRGPVALAPMAGRTERAIIGDTLAMAGITDPARHVDEFVAELARRAPDLKDMFETRGHALPGAAAPTDPGGDPGGDFGFGSPPPGARGSPPEAVR